MQSGDELGPYRLTRRLGAGGMGEVWIGEHAQLGRRAAIKVLHGELARRPEVISRFFNEARATTAISDPGIVQIFDFGSDPTGAAYIVMELLEGETLDKRLHRLGALPVTDALRIMRQVANSLGAAHLRGIIHRDLKPENIFLVADTEVAGGERAKILDFGIAKLTEANGVKTQTAAMLGTPMFMSPEQCRGAGHVDLRTDIYSLGCVLFQLVTGRPPFDADGVGEIIAMHLREPAPLASSVATGIPSAVDELIARCLSKDPNERYGSGAELASAIARIHPSSVHQVSSTVTVTRTSQISPTTLSSAAGVNESPKRGRGLWLGGVLAVTVASGFGVSKLAQSSEPEASMVASSPLSPPRTPVPKAAPQPSRRELTLQAFAAAVDEFAGWSKTQPQAACLDHAAVVDGWGTRLRFTCTEQSDDRIVGVISAGPDETFGTEDDLRSWQLAVELARGPRWRPAPVLAPSKPVRPRPTAVVKTPGSGIPDTRQ